MPKNEAAWLVKRNGPLEVKESPYKPPLENEIIIKNRAIAVNPFDWMIQAAPGLVCSWMKLPFVLGSDCAGEVVEVGSRVKRFKVGDRVLGHALGVDKKRNDVTESAFQNYTRLLEHMSSPIPSMLAFDSAAVLPLGLSTAACGLFQKDHLRFNIRDATLHAPGRHFSCGEALQVSAAMPFSWPSQPDMK